MARPRSRRIDPRAALLTGKLSFKGDMSLAIKLRKWISQAAEEQAAAIGAELEVAEREKWEKDEDAQDCAVCRQPFTVGNIVCQALCWHIHAMRFFFARRT